MTHVHVIVPGYNAGDWLVQCLASIRAQTHRDLSVCVIDDCSTDLRMQKIVEDVNGIDGWTGIVNTERVGATCNIWRALWSRPNPQPRDIVLIVDADDKLSDENAVARIVKVYEDDPNAWLVYGSYECDPPDPAAHPAERYPAAVIRERSFRQWSNLWNHPISALAVVMEQVTEDDLHTPEGEWVPHLYDAAWFLPMAELAGPCIRFMPEIGYTYNASNPLSCVKIDKAECERVGDELKSRPKKPRMYWSDDGLTLAPEDRAAVITQTMLDAHTGWCVETGTGYGDMAYRVASMEWVQRVITIEQDRERYDAAVAKLVACPTVLPILGDSREVLRRIVSEVPAAVWWLDAHRDDWWTGDPGTVCPIMDELYLVLSQEAAHTVLVDDARLFGQADGYPTIEAVESHVANLAEAAGRRYAVAVSHDIIRITPTQ